MLYLNDLVGFETICEVLVVVDVTELIGDDFGFADGGVDIRVGMSVNPDTNAAVCDEMA